MSYPVDPNPGEHQLATLKRILGVFSGSGTTDPNPGESVEPTLKRILAAFLEVANRGETYYEVSDTNARLAGPDPTAQPGLNGIWPLGSFIAEAGRRAVLAVTCQEIPDGDAAELDLSSSTSEPVNLYIDGPLSADALAAEFATQVNTNYPAVASALADGPIVTIEYLAPEEVYVDYNNLVTAELTATGVIPTNRLFETVSLVNQSSESGYSLIQSVDDIQAILGSLATLSTAAANAQSTASSAASTAAAANATANAAMPKAGGTFTGNIVANGTNNTAPNQTAASSSSLITRSLLAAEAALSAAQVFQVNLAMVGYQASASCFAGQLTGAAVVRTGTGAVTNDYAAVNFTGEVLGGTGFGGDQVNFSNHFYLYFDLTGVMQDHAIARILVNGSSFQSTTLSTYGIGVEIIDDNTARLIVHNGTTLSTSATFGWPDYGNSKMLLLENVGNGTVNAWVNSTGGATVGARFSSTPSRTISGGPTGQHGGGNIGASITATGTVSTASWLVAKQMRLIFP